MIFKNIDLLDDYVSSSDGVSFYLIESEKERNLYFKFFAGFYFNELIDGYTSRMKGFLKLLKVKISNGHDIFNIHSKPSQLKGTIGLIRSLEETPNHIHVSFDYHAYLWKEKGDSKFDRGEMSDVVLFGDKGFISIEVKFLENWDFKNDIESVQNRMNLVKEKYVNLTKKDFIPLQILLTTKSKFYGLQQHESFANSNLEKLKSLKENPDIPFPILLITWEEILELLIEPSYLPVFKYMNKQLNRKK